MSDDIMIKEGYMYGQWRKGINPSRSRVGSIHDDATGKKVGMRGGVIAGTIHHDLFPPILLKAFGQHWFEQGSVSLFYLYAMLEDEELRAIVQVPPKDAKDVQLEARLESRDGHKVAEGTVSVGNPKVKSHLLALELASSPREERRILKELEVGLEIPPVDVAVTKDGLGEMLPNCEDVVAWYSGNSPWGPAILPLSQVSVLMRIKPPFEIKGVGFFGANETRYVNGPVKVDVPYVAKGKIVAVGVTSKTEYFWYDSQLYEKASNKLVATMRHMTRLMKAGSPLYPEIPTGK